MNRQWIVCLMAGSMLSACLLGCQPSKDPAVYYEQALQSYENKDYEQSLIQLKMALKFDPSNGKIRKKLGEVWLKLGDPQACITQFEKAESLGVHPNQFILPMAQCYLYQGDTEAVLALDYRGKLLKVSNQAYALLHAYKAQALMKDQAFNEALDELDQAEMLMATLPEVQQTKALWFAYQRDFDEALELLDQMIEKSPKFAQAWGLKADIYRFLNQPQDAEDAYSKAILYTNNKLDKRDFYVYRALVRVFRQDNEGAQEDLKQIYDLKLGHIGAFYVQGLIALSENKPDAAIEYFQKVMTQKNPLLFGHYFLGLSYVLNNNMHPAREQLVRFVHEMPEHYLGQKLLGLVELKLNEREQAKTRLLSLIERKPKDPDLYHWLGELYLNEGQVEKGIHYLQKTVDLKPNDAGASLQMGIAHLSLGDEQNAQWAFDKVLKKYPKNRYALLMKFVAEYKAKHFQLAKNIAKTYIKHHPDDTLGHNLLGVVCLSDNQTEEAKSSFLEALSIDPHDPNAHTQLALMRMRQHRTASAVEHYEKILEAYEHVPTLLRMAKLNLKDPNRDEEGIAYLERAIQAQPAQLLAYLVLARQHMAQAHLEKAKRTLNKVPDRYRKHPEFLAAQGLLYLADEKPLLASQKWEQIEHRLPEVKKAPLTYELGARIAYQQKDWGRLAELSQALLKRHPRGHWARLNAVSLWQLGQKSQALDRLDRWIDHHPEDEVSKFWYANYLMQANAYDKAESIYRSLLQNNPKNPIIYNNLAWILKDKSPEKAREFVDQALVLKPNWAQALNTLKTLEAQEHL